MANTFHLIQHPLIDHKLSIIRDEKTPNNYFRSLIKEVTTLMLFEFSKHLSTKSIQVKTPITLMHGKSVQDDILVVPILRAGLGMLDAFTDMIPQANVGHIGLARNEKTLEASTYIVKIPKINQQTEVFILDPMLATGGSLLKAIDLIKAKGGTKITYVGIVGVQVGIDRITKAHPEVKIYLSALDQKLNESGYIYPGLGDCGDRLYGKED
jgi:uracil phosphoribosyltransferase